MVFYRDLCYDRKMTWTKIDESVSKFADDTKFGGVVDSEEGCQKIHGIWIRDGRRNGR